MPCDAGYVFNNTIFSCVRSCLNDTNSLLIYAPWNVKECYCLSNFKWDIPSMRCKLINVCDLDLNFNGVISCDLLH